MYICIYTRLTTPQMELSRPVRTNWTQTLYKNIIFKNLNWQEADQLAIYKVQQRS